MKSLHTALTVAAAGVLALIATSPASAAGAAIDPGDSMYVVACDPSYPDFQLLSVDPSTAVATTIGTGAPDLSECSGQPAYDPTTGRSYFVGWYGDGTVLVEMNVATGVSLDVAPFFFGSGEFPLNIDVDSIAIGADGSAYAIDGDQLYELDLTTGVLTNPQTMSISEFFGFAYDTVTSAFYVISTANAMFELDPSDASLAPVGTVVFPEPLDESTTWSLQFDGAGRAWIEADNGESGGAGLWSFTLATLNAPVYAGNFTDDPFYTEALLIIAGDPVLAKTGVDGSANSWLAAGAAGVALAGLALVVVRRRAVSGR